MSSHIHKRTEKGGGETIPSIQKDDTPIWLLEKQERIKRLASKFLNGDNNTICDFSDRVINRVKKRSKKRKHHKRHVRPADNLSEKRPELLVIAGRIISEKRLPIDAPALVKEAISTHLSLKKCFYFDDTRQLIYDLAEIHYGNLIAEREFETRIQQAEEQRKNNVKNQKPKKAKKQLQKKRKKKRSARPIRELWREANQRYIAKQKELLTDVYVKSLLKPTNRTPENIAKKRRQLKIRQKQLINNNLQT